MKVDVFEINKSAFFINHKSFEWIFAKPNLPSFDLVSAKNNEWTCYIQNKWLASRYDPAEEAVRFVKNHNINEGDLIVLYGFGLGYHLKPILEKIGEKGYLYCIETNIQLLKTALKAVDLTEVFKSENFKLITGKDNTEVAEAFDHYILWNLETIPEANIKVIIHEASFSLIPQEFNWIQNALELIKFEKRADSYFLDDMKINLKNNISTVLNSPGINQLKNIFLNKPVIFAGAGPSLDKAIPSIYKLQDNAFIVCVDTAVIPLNQNKIRPDLIVSVDPQDKSLEDFVKYEDLDVPIIILPTTSKEVVSKTKARKITAIQTGSWVSDFFEHRLDFMGLTFGGSSVSVIGADIVLNHTKGPVIFAGMDFSFPELKPYANYSPEFNKWHNKTGPYYTLEMVAIENIYSKKIVNIESFFGVNLLTFQSMYSYLRSLEAIVDFHKRTDVYAYSPGGAKIENVTPIIFEEELLNIIPEKISKEVNFSSFKQDESIVNFCYEKLGNLDAYELSSKK
ncbi:MAG: hypothetical protein ACD_79C00859G0002 [uncultured bacterium]|nr:MAG: hypothetical protein ACD_79C00859G0002 [uncultured bacterium]